MGATDTYFVGIDVSKDTLDTCLLRPDGRAQEATFGNDPQGYAALAAWADRLAGGLPLHFCMEATGPYSDGPATALAEAGRRVSVANPARVRSHGLAGGQGNKTDRADARGIAAYARDRTPPPWRPPSPEARQVRALVHRRDDLREMAAREKGRLAAPNLTAAARLSIARTIRFLGREADRVQAEADALIAASPALEADRALLESIAGIGPQTASTVLAELPPIAQLPSAESAAAYCGLAPREFRSGASIRKRTRLSKTGSARLRKALFLPTLAAIRYNPVVRRFYTRLVERGKAKMAAVGACMRKLVMICYGVLKGRVPFDPNRTVVRPAGGGSCGQPSSAGRILES
jgi:transposase